MSFVLNSFFQIICYTSNWFISTAQSRKSLIFMLTVVNVCVCVCMFVIRLKPYIVILIKTLRFVCRDIFWPPCDGVSSRIWYYIFWYIHCRKKGKYPIFKLSRFTATLIEYAHIYIFNLLQKQMFFISEIQWILKTVTFV